MNQTAQVPTGDSWNLCVWCVFFWCSTIFVWMTWNLNKEFEYLYDILGSFRRLEGVLPLLPFVTLGWVKKGNFKLEITKPHHFTITMHIS